MSKNASGFSPEIHAATPCFCPAAKALYKECCFRILCRGKPVNFLLKRELLIAIFAYIRYNGKGLETARSVLNQLFDDVGVNVLRIVLEMVAHLARLVFGRHDKV